MQRAPLAVPRTGRRERFREARRTADPVWQRRFLDEQQVIDDFCRDAAHQLHDPDVLSWRGDKGRVQGGICGARFPPGAREEVGHVRLMRKHEERGDVAQRGTIAVRVEQSLEGKHVHPGVDFADSPFGSRRVPLLNNTCNLLAGPDDAPVSARILHNCRQNRRGRSRRVMAIDQRVKGF